MGRFSRQIALSEIGEEGQQRLRDAVVAIVGLGALGSVQAELLCRAGVGKLILIDHDLVERSNLQRQALYTDADVGKLKVEAALAHLKAIDPEVNISIAAGYLTVPRLHSLDEADLILDGTDNMETRFLLNEYALKNKRPAIFTSAVADRGTVFVVDSRVNGSLVATNNPRRPCFNCIFHGRRSTDDCGSAGVLNGATHLASSVAATEAIKLLVGLPVLEGLFSFSLFDSRFDTFEAKPRKDCAACAGEYPRLAGKVPFALRFCERRDCVVAEPVSLQGGPELFAGFDAHEREDGTLYIIEADAGADAVRQPVLLDSKGGLSFLGLRSTDQAALFLERILKNNHK